MTKVISLIGGSGLGKSTTAAGLYYEMKLQGLHVELVREYVKQWAWEGKKVGPHDQVYLFGKQAHYESALYGKVDYVVTDSPLLLCVIYERFYTGDSTVEESALKFLNKAKASGVEHHYILLSRHKPFDTRGRYETEETARKVDEFTRQELTRMGIAFTEVTTADRARVADIIRLISTQKCH